MIPINFPDHPEFTPNISPAEMFRLGVFGGTYFRPIYSSITKKTYKDKHKEFEWHKTINPRYLTSTKCNIKLNYYKVKSGSSLSDWESKGWIVKQDPYGWVQWYCRFYEGRRSKDDDRQIGRWLRFAGDNGRFKKRLVNKIKREGKSYDDQSVSPVIRQGLLQWACMITEDDLI